MCIKQTPVSKVLEIKEHSVSGLVGVTVTCGAGIGGLVDV